MAMMSNKECIRRFPVGSVFDVSQNDEGQWQKSVVSVNTVSVFKLTTYRITAEEAETLKRSMAKLHEGKVRKLKKRRKKH